MGQVQTRILQNQTAVTNSEYVPSCQGKGAFLQEITQQHMFKFQLHREYFLYCAVILHCAHNVMIT